MVMLDWGLRWYVLVLALPPAVRTVQEPGWILWWERISVAGETERREREKKESVKMYLGSGRPC